MTWQEFLAQKDIYIGRKITCDEVVLKTSGVITKIRTEGEMVFFDYQKRDLTFNYFSANMKFFDVVFDKRTGQTMINPDEPLFPLRFVIGRKQ